MATIACDRCGFEGDKELFRHIGNVMCCGPLVFKKCPKCNEPVICDRQEMRGEIEDTARQVSCQVEDAVENGDFDLAKKVLGELYQLNQTLNIDSIDDYIRQTRRRINKLRAAS